MYTVEALSFLIWLGFLFVIVYIIVFVFIQPYLFICSFSFQKIIGFIFDYLRDRADASEIPLLI